MSVVGNHRVFCESELSIITADLAWTLWLGIYCVHLFNGCECGAVATALDLRLEIAGSIPAAALSGGTLGPLSASSIIPPPI